MTTPLNEEQRKKIEQEAKNIPKSTDYYGAYEHHCKGQGYIIGATKYATLCQQKDEEIARLRLKIELMHSYTSAGPGVLQMNQALKEIANIATETLKQ